MWNWFVGTFSSNKPSLVVKPLAQRCQTWILWRCIVCCKLATTRRLLNAAQTLISLNIAACWSQAWLSSLVLFAFKLRMVIKANHTTMHTTFAWTTWFGILASFPFDVVIPANTVAILSVVIQILDRGRGFGSLALPLAFLVGVLIITWFTFVTRFGWSTTTSTSFQRARKQMIQHSWVWFNGHQSIINRTLASSIFLDCCEFFRNPQPSSPVGTQALIHANPWITRRWHHLQITKEELMKLLHDTECCSTHEIKCKSPPCKSLRQIQLRLDVALVNTLSILHWQMRTSINYKFTWWLLSWNLTGPCSKLMRLGIKDWIFFQHITNNVVRCMRAFIRSSKTDSWQTCFLSCNAMGPFSRCKFNFTCATSVPSTALLTIAIESVWASKTNRLIAERVPRETESGSPLLISRLKDTSSGVMPGVVKTKARREREFTPRAIRSLTSPSVSPLLNALALKVASLSSNDDILWTS